MHVGRTPESVAWLAEDLRQIECEVGDRVAFIAATGDLTNLGTAEECRMYLDAIRDCRLPIRPCVGNHDYINGPWEQRTNDAASYQQLISPLNFSFDHEGVHFVSYDYMEEGNSDRPSPWLLEDLAALPSGTPIIFLVHHQLHASFYEQLRPFHIVATLSGHWHSSRLYHDGRIEHFNGPSLCFGGIDYSPRAYRVFRWDGTKLNCETIPFKRPRKTRPPGRRNGELWRTPLHGEILLASPLLQDHRLFLGLMDENRTRKGAVACWDAETGEELWRTPLASSVKNTVAAADGKVFAVTVTGELVALDAATGKLVWSCQLGDASQRWVFSSPCVHDGRVYAGQGPHFAAVDAHTGNPLWVRNDLTTWDWISSYTSPVCDGARVIIGFHWQPNSVQALDVTTGQTVWRIENPQRPSMPVSSPALHDGAVFLNRRHGLGKIDAATGREQWEFELGEMWSPSTPAIDGDTIYAASGAGKLFAIDATTGTPRWSWECGDDLEAMHPYRRTGKTIVSSPRAHGQLVWVGANDGRLVALDKASGQLVAAHEFGVAVTSSPVVTDRAIFLAARDGHLYALKP